MNCIHRTVPTYFRKVKWWTRIPQESFNSFSEAKSMNNQYNRPAVILHMIICCHPTEYNPKDCASKNTTPKLSSHIVALFTCIPLLMSKNLNKFMLNSYWQNITLLRTFWDFDYLSLCLLVQVKATLIESSSHKILIKNSSARILWAHYSYLSWDIFLGSLFRSQLRYSPGLTFALSVEISSQLKPWRLSWLPEPNSCRPDTWTRMEEVEGFGLDIDSGIHC